MILAAALLVLVALGLFVGGIVTGNTTLYWACVGVSAGAAVLLVLARRQLGRPAPVSVREPAGAAPRRTSITKEPARTTTATTDAAAPAEPPAPPAEPPAPPAAEAAPPAEPPAPPAEPPAPPAEPPAPPAAEAAPPAGAPAAETPPAPLEAAGGEPGVEDVEVTDMLLVVDLRDEVLVVDEHPRYHLARCAWLAGRETIPLPVDEARQDGFTPCAVCTPDRHLADAERARRAARRAP